MISLEFLACLFVALCVLMAQALIIQLSAVRALEQALLGRWEALVSLESMFLFQVWECCHEGEGCSEDIRGEIERLRVRLTERLSPQSFEALETLRTVRLLVDAAVPLIRPAMERKALRLGIARHWGAMLPRIANAREDYECAVQDYEFRRCALRMQGLMAWFGYNRYSSVGISTIVR